MHLHFLLSIMLIRNTHIYTAVPLAAAAQSSDMHLKIEIAGS